MGCTKAAFCMPTHGAGNWLTGRSHVCDGRSSVMGHSSRVHVSLRSVGTLKRRCARMASDERGASDDAGTGSPDADKEEDDKVDVDTDRARETNDEPRRQHDIPRSSIDWNKSWSDFQASGGRSMAPSGREPVTKEEVARQKALNRLRSVSNSLPSRQKLFADWRFWVSIILALSLFTAYVQSSSSVPHTI